MRTPDGRLIADLNNKIPALVTGSLTYVNKAIINENLTEYSLIPGRINSKPYESESIYNLSTPQIKPIQFNDPNKTYLYLNDEGTVKVAAGANFTLKFLGVQPPINNVENGVLTMYDNQENLIYEWQKDGNSITTPIYDVTRPSSSAIVETQYGRELIFTNISSKHTGIYSCTVSNDIGSVTSEQVYIDVVIPDQNDMFYKNLVKNPNGATGTDEWSGDSEFIAGKLSAANFADVSKVWRPDVFAYTKDMFFPRPYHINTYHIRNSDLEENILKDGNYFTRDKWEYIVNDGQRVIQAETEVDLTELKDYIQGSIYGVEGVSAIFGCYIGNAVSRYRVTIINALITARTNKYSLLPNQTRLSILNTLLAGAPNFVENVEVYIQEYNEETPLITNGNYKGYKITDEWSKHLNRYIPPGTYDDGVPYGIPASGDYNLKVVHIVDNNLLFPSKDQVATYGQYAKFNRFVIDKLNYLTTKVKITVVFQASDILNETNGTWVNSGDVLEFFPWEGIVRPFKYPSSDDSYFTTKSINNETYYPTIGGYNKDYYGYKDNEVNKWMTVLGKPRVLATGFNFVLLPIETSQPKKTNYYKQNILAPIDKNISSDGLTYEYPKTDTESVGSYMNQYKYPSVDSGLVETTDTGIYLATLAAKGYEYEVIGVEIEHELNIPTSDVNRVWSKITDISSKSVMATWRYGGGVQPASITKVKTYQLTKNPNPEDLSFNNTSSWLPIALQNIESLQNDTIGTVIYNTTQDDDITNCTLEQVLGNIQTGIAKYTNNLISIVPANFATASFRLSEYRPTIGFNLELEGKKYGINKTPYNISNKEKLVEEWKIYSGSLGTQNFYFRLLEDVSKRNQGTATTYTPATKATQYIVYSNKLYENLQRDISWWTANSNDLIYRNQQLSDITFREAKRLRAPAYRGWNDLYITREYNYPLKTAHVYNASNLFQFTPTSYYEYEASNGKGYYSAVLPSSLLHTDNLNNNIYEDYKVYSPMFDQWWDYANYDNPRFLSSQYITSVGEAAQLIQQFRNADTGTTAYYSDGTTTIEIPGKPTLDIRQTLTPERDGLVPPQWYYLTTSGNIPSATTYRPTSNWAAKMVSSASWANYLNWKQGLPAYSASNATQTITIPNKFRGLLTPITASDGSVVDIRNFEGTTMPSGYDLFGKYSVYDYVDENQNLPRIRAESSTWGATNSRVALNKVTTTGTMSTPSAIVEPVRKKITYFVYSYNNNIKAE